jgi:peptidoglycan/xylan/chitin deacetylase (PgdA/CDA1 family)
VLQLRNAVKSAAERTIVLSGLESIGRRLRSGRTYVLAYHNIIPDEFVGLGDRSLHLGLSAFRMHLDFFARYTEVPSLTEVLNGRGPRGEGKPRVVLTFDDAYRGAVRLGIPEARRRGLPVTVCVAPGLLGDQSLWWDALADDSHAGPPPALREQVLTEGRGDSGEALAMADRHGISPREMHPMFRTCSLGELEDVCSEDGLTVASHSWTHPSLDRLTGPELETELSRPRDWLLERFGPRYVDVVAYPYGRYSDEVLAATRRVGYRAGLTLEPRMLRAGELPADGSLPRKNVPAGLSLDGLRIRLALR